MKILFMGSIPTFERTETRELTEAEQPFARACEQMGYAAAARQHTILISDNHPSSADYHVLNGILKFIAEAPERTAQLLVNRPQGSELVFDRLPQSVVVSYRFHPDVERVWHGTLIPNLAALEACDVMITLGGRLTVKLMGHLAADRERPVLAIPSFGGRSSEIFESLKFTYRLLMLDDTEPPIRFTNLLRQAGRDRIQRELSIRRLVEEEHEIEK